MDAATAVSTLALTDEQRAVIDHDIGAGETLIVNAFAGSGKTSTILARIEQRSYPADRPVLYVAFNQTTQQEMAKRSKKNTPVDSRTYHSLATRYTCWSLDRRRLVIDPLQPGGVRGYTAAARILKRYWKDTTGDYGWAKEPQPSHMNPGETIGDLEQARRAWKRMLTEPDVAWTHDATLKYLCMNGEESETWITALYSEMIVDEAQDVQGVLMQWLLSFTKIPLLLVGDGHQSIYSFTGARNAIESATMRATTPTMLRLTRSFRFGPTIAQCASLLLHSAHLLPSDVSVSGTPSLTGTVLSNRGSNPLTLGGPLTCIARSNATIFTLALKALGAGRQVRFVGRSREIVGTIGKLLERFPRRIDVERRCQQLKARDRSAASSVADDDHHSSNPLNETERDEMEKLQMIMEYGHAKLKKAISTLKAQGRKRKRDPTTEFTLCTVHGAKGLEWERVYLCNDFPCLERLLWALEQAREPLASDRQAYKEQYPFPASCECEGHECRHGHAARLLCEAGLIRDPDNMDDEDSDHVDVEKIREEVHVYYVAMTRAKRVLYANASLTPMLRPHMSATDNLRSQQAAAFFSGGARDGGGGVGRKSIKTT